MPIRASLLDIRRDLASSNLFGLDQKVDVKTNARVPGGVAVKAPYTRVLGIKLYNEISVASEELRVGPGWVYPISNAAVPRSV